MTAPSPFALRLTTVALCAFAIRVAIRAVVGTDGYWDDGYTMYRSLADNLAAGHGYAFPGEGPTAFRVPLYPLFIAIVTGGGGSAWALIVAQAVVSAGLVVIAGLLARHLYGRAAGLVAAAWCAAYPYYAWHDLSLQESGLFAALTALATLLLLRTRRDRSTAAALGGGAALGLAILTRSMLVPFALLALGWLVIADGHALRKRAVSALLTVAAMAAVLTPWVVRQHALTGSFGLGTETGQSLYAGASPLLFSAFPAQSVDVSRQKIFAAIPPDAVRERDRFAAGSPARESAWYSAQALALAQADLPGYLARAVRKLAVAFGPRPVPHHGWLADLAYAACWLPLLVLGLVGAWQDRANWRVTGLFAAHFAAFAAVTAVMWAQTAHRAYLDVYLMVLAAPAVLRMLPAKWREALGR